ncbi:MAG TPA: saccharopine dehydrogenase C-terminal domain-containing protein [Anaerolineales bacterium]|nr:saccharopine dehydrogenase C-terminal domain-containing protein [Anaerolineales bacterium]
MKILLLGVGLQGKAALHHLVNSSAVTKVIAADVNHNDLITYVDSLKTDKVIPIELDVRDNVQVARQMQLVQAAIILLPQQFRLGMAKLAIENNIHFIETSYKMPEYAELDKPAREKEIAILPECGLDPGIDLVLAGRAVREFDEVHELHAYGTGVPEPEVASNPLKYKISWTFAGVLNAYQRPARLLKNRQVIDLTPSEMFDPVNIHMVDVEGLGHMEAYYNGDAVKYLEVLRIKDTASNTGRYSLRWPGHSAFWKKMVELGFLDEEPIKVGRQEISPRQFVHDLLLPQLQYQESERDVAAIRIEVTGLKNGQHKRVIYQMIDRRDLNTGLLAMQRTVGYTTSIGAQMILKGQIQKRGLLTPTRDIPSDIFIEELEKVNINIQRQEFTLDT